MPKLLKYKHVSKQQNANIRWLGEVLWCCLQCNKRMLLLLWCVSTKTGEILSTGEAQQRGKERPNIFLQLYSYSLMDLLLPHPKYSGRHKDSPPPPWLLTPCCVVRNQKPKISCSTAPRLLGAFPFVLSQSGSESQSWGVTPMSRTWGLLRDNARLRRQEKYDQMNPLVFIEEKKKRKRKTSDL